MFVQLKKHLSHLLSRDEILSITKLLSIDILEIALLVFVDVLFANAHPLVASIIFLFVDANPS